MIPPMNAGVGRPALPQSPAPPQIQFQNQIKPHSVAGPPAVQPRPDFFSSPPRITQENPPDVLNNIIVHIYLNAKGKQVHATATSGPIKGLFGIGTSHGGPGTHSNPIVITKDFDRDTLKFVEEHKAQQMVEEGPANIVEVKATVSSPDRKMDHSLNKAVNSELDRAIPLVLNRMQGPMGNLDDDDLRKELEQALVDELAKNLGETIDQMGTSGVDDDDLGKLIEEGFNEIEKELQASSSTFTPPATTTTQPITTRRITTTTTGRRTSSSTTSRRTTTSVVEEMMEESPFERTQPPMHREPSSRKTSPPRTTTSTRPTTTSVRTTPEATTECRTVPLHEQTTTEVGVTHREGKCVVYEWFKVTQICEVTEVSMTRVAPAKTTTKPSTFAEQNMINRQPHFEVPPRKQTVPSGKQGESTIWREEEPRIVTSRPVHVVSLDEETEATTRTTTRRGTTMGRRITTTTATTSTTTTSLPPEAETVQPVPETFFMPKEPCPTVNDPSDTNRTDVLFLLDSSNAFNQQKFMHAIKLIIETVSQFRNIGPNGTQVSLVQFNTEPYLEFSLRKHNCKQWLIDDIADTDYMQGGSMLGKAVEKVSRFAFTKNRVAKKHNLTVLVIATLEANPQYLMDLAGNMNNVFQLHTDIKHTLPHKLAERINSIQAEFAPSDSFEVKDGHGMITVALPSEEEEEGERVEHVGGEEEEEMEDGREGQEEGEFPVATHTSVPIVPTVSSPSSISMDAQRLVQLQCSPLGFKISLNVPPGYEGVAVVKGQEDKEECTKNIHALESSTNLTVVFFVASKSCGVTRVHSVQPPGTNYTLILHLKHSVPLVTGGDRAYLLQCYIGKPSEDQELTADLGVMKGELMIAETISLLSVPPTCVYSIRKDSADGPIVKNAFVGQTVYHRWECDGGEEANNVYGIQIHDCFASDDVDKKFPIVDNRGCSSDLTLLSDPRYSDSSLTAYAESKAFAFTEADQLKFVCKLSLCTRDGDGCEGVTPPVCGGNSPEQLVTRRIRHQNSAMEGALSSALSTRVGVATSMPSTLKERLTNLLSSGGSWIVLALLAVIAAVGTVVLSRFALSSPYATTTCSDPETMTSPPTSPFPSLFSSPPMSPTPLVDSPPTSSISSPVPAESAPREELAICEINEEPSSGPFSQGDAGQSPIETAPVSERTVEPPQPSERRPSRAEMNKRLAPFLVDFDRSKYV
nr:von Willebrand factor and Endoglin CD105 antigen domain containing protein [Haemonchus contortus]